MFTFASSMASSEHIHPIFEQMLQRADKERLLRQQGRVLWFTGLSGSGKSTVARVVEEKLHRQGRHTVLLDGDNVRTGINRNLGFSEADRTENIRRIAEVAKLFVQNGSIVLCSFVSPTEDLRVLARDIIGKEDFIEVFVHCPLEVCEARDVKGLYAKARRGEIPDFTGISAPFEAPKQPELVIHTHRDSPEACVQQVLDNLHPIIEYKDPA